METCEVTFDVTMPCTTLAFEDFPAPIDYDDDAGSHPSPAAQELPSASTTSTEGPDATTASRFASPLHDQAEALAIIEGEATSEREAP